MSGFFGILRTDGQEIDRGLLEKISGRLRFRGRDGETIWIQKGVGTCYAYCRTDPKEEGQQQPVALGEDWILGDVRVDARKELKEKFVKSGARAAEDASSEELLLQAWRSWGETCLEQIIGDFSFALWDGSEQSLWCVRDFVGARPLYYAQTSGIFCFSNTLGAFLLVPGITRDLDETFVGEFLLHGYCSDPTRTVYSGIRRLAAGHKLKFRDGKSDVSRYLTLPIEQTYRFSKDKEYLERYREVLHEAVQDRLPQGPSALYLSGGLDSGSVCAVATRIAIQRGNKSSLKAFTVGWNPLFEDPEPNFAARSANYLGIAHEVLEDRNFAPFSRSQEWESAAPEPDIEAFFSRAQGQYRRISEHSPVILSGDGGDDVLTGQAWPYFANLWASGEWPEIIRSAGRFAWSHGRLPPLRAGIRARVTGMLKTGGRWKGYPGWLNAEFETKNGLRDKWVEDAPTVECEHPVHPRAYACLHQGFWSSVLESEDASNTNVPLETRAPLLDLRVLKFLLRIPPVPWCVDKELTRRAMKEYLPDDILQRPKTPLLRDPLEACVEKGIWNPRALGSNEPSERIHEFVNWKQCVATLESSKGCKIGTNLFALVLERWLKDVENGWRIQ
jgi:asparagine synthase (glutamine-hydrolysing)